MIKEIRNQLRDVLNPSNAFITYPTIDPQITLADYAPKTQQGWEGYVIYVNPPNGSASREDDVVINDAMAWEIRVRAMMEGIRDSNQVQNDMVDIADAIIEYFVNNAVLKTDTAIDDVYLDQNFNYGFSYEPYPQSTNALRYTFTLNINMTTQRYRTCN